ncbi:uncharacterized protein LOC121396005 [Xenopus laevis]|uniref:Uncharacterized protein LOC121396005 n=1 Tax=Xenopus laevis TaxID=8355 RepID=A0A8J1LAB3_XENLA|nr:uncharacterized protein LOC121396005 [Xenopus laevis]
MLSFFPVLRPYKNGLMVKSGKISNVDCQKQKDTMQIEDTEAYVGETPEYSSALDALEENDSSASDTQPYSPVSDDDLEELALLSQSYNGHDLVYTNGLSLNAFHKGSLSTREDLLNDKNAMTKSQRCASSMRNLKLSPVEEPNEEFVDTMDELQCLVESVSEYLAEKEEEINKFHDLTGNNLNSTNLVNKQNARDVIEKLPLNVEERDKERTVQPESLTDLSGLKNTVNCFFSSFSQKVGSGAKQISASVEKMVSSSPEKSENPISGGISKIFSSRSVASGNLPNVKNSHHEDQTLNQDIPTPHQSAIKMNCNMETRKLDGSSISEITNSHTPESHNLPSKKLDMKVVDTSDALPTQAYDSSKIMHKATLGHMKPTEKSSLTAEVTYNPLLRSNNPDPKNTVFEKMKDDEIINDKPMGKSAADSPQKSSAEFLNPLKKSISQLFSFSESPVDKQENLAKARVYKSENDLHKNDFFSIGKKIQIPFLNSSSSSDSGAKNSPFEKKENVDFLDQSPKKEELPKRSSLQQISTVKKDCMYQNNAGVESKSNDINTQQLCGIAATREEENCKNKINISSNGSCSEASCNNEGRVPFDDKFKSNPTVEGEGSTNTFISKLIRFASTENLSTTKENTFKQKESSQTGRTSGLLSGLFKFASSDNLSKQNPANSCYGTQGKASTEGTNPFNAERGSDKTEDGFFSRIKSILPKQEESVSNLKQPEVYQQVKLLHEEQKTTFKDKTNSHCKLEPLSRDVSVQFDNDFEDSGLYWMDDYEKISEKNTSFVQNNMPDISYKHQWVEDSRSQASFEWEYDTASWHSDQYPANLVVNQNYLSSQTNLTESNDTVINLCQRDNNANVDWISFIPVEQQNLDPVDVWTSSASCEQGINVAPVAEDTTSFSEGLPMDLSYSSNCDGNLWTLIDQESLNLDESILYNDDSTLYSDDYFEWLALLEFGLWWPSGDGDCGYYMYSDGQYIYSLLTDPTGEYVYVCTPDTYSYLDYEDLLQGDYSHTDDIIICGFKVPLSHGISSLFMVEEQTEHNMENYPLDLASNRSDQLMNMNLATFSHMFEESIHSQIDQPLDFSSRKLKKVKVDLRSESDVQFPEKYPVCLDLRKHHKFSPCVEESHSVSNKSKSASASDKGIVKIPGFNIFKSSNQDDVQSMDKPSSDNKSQFNPVSSLFSSLGGLFGKTADTKGSSVNVDGPSKLADFTTNEFLSSNKNFTKNQSQESIKFTNNIGDIHDASSLHLLSESPKNTPLTLQTDCQNKNVNNTPPPVNISKLNTDNMNLGKANHEQFHGGSVDAKPGPDVPEKNLFQSAMQIFNISEKASTKESNETGNISGFFNFFKTQTDTGSSHSVKNPHHPDTKLMDLKEDKDKPTDTTSNEAKESLGIGSLFGSIGEIFKTETISAKVSDNMKSSYSLQNETAVAAKINASTLNTEKHKEATSKESSAITSIFGSIGDLFKMETSPTKGSENIKPSSDPQCSSITHVPDKHDANAQKENTESSGIASIFGSLGELFKTETISTMPSDDGKIEISFGINENKQVGSYNAGPARIKTLKKQETISHVRRDPECCQEDKEFTHSQESFKTRTRCLKKQGTIRETGLDPHPVTRSYDQSMMSMNLNSHSAFAETSSNACSEKFHQEDSGQSSNVCIDQAKPIISEKIQSKPVWKEEPQTKSSTQSAQVAESLSQTASSIFSFFSRPEKPQPAPKQTPSQDSQPQGLFKLPSLFSSNNSQSTSQSSTSFSSIFGFSIFDEKNQTGPDASRASRQDINMCRSQAHENAKLIQDEANRANKSELGVAFPISDKKTHSNIDYTVSTQLTDTFSEHYDTTDPNLDYPISDTFSENNFVSDEESLTKLVSPISEQVTDAFSENYLRGDKTLSNLDNRISEQLEDHNYDDFQPPEHGELTSEDFRVDTDSFVCEQEPTFAESCTIFDPQDHFDDKSLSTTQENIDISTINSSLQNETSTSKESKMSQNCLNLPQPPIENISLQQTLDDPMPTNQPKESIQEKTVFDSSVEMFSSFMSKINVFSSEPPKTSSSFSFTPQSTSSLPKKNSLFNISSGPQNKTFSTDLFGIFTSPSPAPSKMAETLVKDPKQSGVPNVSMPTAVHINKHLIKQSEICEGVAFDESSETMKENHLKTDDVIETQIVCPSEAAPSDNKDLVHDIDLCIVNRTEECGSHISGTDNSSQHLSVAESSSELFDANTDLQINAQNVTLSEPENAAKDSLSSNFNVQSMITSPSHVPQALGKDAGYIPLPTHPPPPPASETLEFGFMSSLKKFSSSLFDMGNEGKYNKQYDSQSSVFGKIELSFPWQKDSKEGLLGSAVDSHQVVLQSPPKNVTAKNEENLHTDSIALNQENKDLFHPLSSALPVEGSSSALPVEGSSSALPVEGSSSALPIEDITSALPVRESHSILPAEESPSKLSDNESSQACKLPSDKPLSTEDSISASSSPTPVFEKCSRSSLDDQYEPELKPSELTVPSRTGTPTYSQKQSEKIQVEPRKPKRPVYSECIINGIRCHL